MKKILRSIILTSVSIYIASILVRGFSFSSSWKVLALSGVVLAMVNFLVKPVIKVITVPINILTLGLFSWLLDVLALYFTVLLVDGLTIIPFEFPGMTIGGFVVPKVYLSEFWVTVVAALIISAVNGFLRWLYD